MLHLLTDDAQQVMFRARDDAIRNGRWSVEPEDMFVALLAQPQGELATALARLGVSAEDVTQKLAQRLSSQAAATNPTEFPFSTRTRQALTNAARLGGTQVTPKHLIVGVIEASAMVKSALADLGVVPQALTDSL